MYNDYFGLKETPFTISPDPRYLFMSERHRDALAHLLYGIGAGGGFVLLTGEVGTGKTTVSRCLLEQLPDNVRLAFILNPKLNSVELMATMCDELQIEYDKSENSLKAFTDLLSQRLLANHEQGLNTVLMIDEAQNLSVEVLEQIRLLTNLETNQKKLLQIILIGQPELQELLAKKELRQLAQRITARYHLRPLSLQETKSYLEHRLRVAGLNKPIFKNAAVQQIHRSSQGIPRLINVISDRSLLGAFSLQQASVNVKTVQKAVAEVMGHNAKPLAQEEYSYQRSNFMKYLLSALTAIGVIFVALFAWNTYQNSSSRADSQLHNSSSKQQVVVNEVVEQTPLQQQTTVIEQLANKAEKEQVDNRSIDQLAQDFWGEQSWDRSGALAAKNLFALWGLDYIPFQSSQACQFAKSYSLSCDEGQSNWQFIAKLNRPVNLKLNSKNSGTFWGTLINLDKDLATIQFGNNRVTISKKKLNPLWTGEYRLFWKMPVGFLGQLSVGAYGKNVQWLTANIETIDGNQFLPDNRFTNQVKKWVENFQSENGLLADGVIGKHTVMMLNNLTVSNIPKLDDGV